jgi:hypothetical protein
MIARGDHIHAIFTELRDHILSQPKTAGGIFSIGDAQFQMMLGDQIWKEAGDGSSTGSAHDIGNKQDVHEEALSSP